MSVAFDPAKPSIYDEDLVLVDRVLGKDESAFHSLYERYHDKVFSISRGILLDSEEAADAVQQIFTLVFRNLHRFDRRSKFSTWLFRIAVNRSIQQARSIKFKKHLVPLNQAFEEPDPAGHDELPDPRIETAMARLSPPDRALLTLFYWDELSLLEIGESLDCSPNAAKTRLFRARERFRTFYEEAVE